MDPELIPEVGEFVQEWGVDIVEHGADVLESVGEGLHAAAALSVASLPTTRLLSSRPFARRPRYRMGW